MTADPVNAPGNKTGAGALSAQGSAEYLTSRLWVPRNMASTSCGA